MSHHAFRKRWPVLVTVLCLSPLAPADIVVLKDGERVEGRVTDGKTPQMLRVETPRGIVIELERSRIREVIPKELPDVEFERRLAQVPDGELEPLVELLVWAREKGLRSSLEKVARRIVRMDPNHPVAREALGYVVFENRWIRESELRKRAGLVKFRGEWMTAADRERRRLVDARREVKELFDTVISDNPYLQEFAVRKLLSYRGAGGLDLFLPYLDDPREAVRLVSASASFQLSVAILKSPATGGERRRAEDVLHRTLRKAWVPLLFDAVYSPPADVGPTEGKRKGSRKPREQPAIRAALKKALGVDHGYDRAAWHAWWRANAHRFRDVDPAPRGGS